MKKSVIKKQNSFNKNLFIEIISKISLGFFMGVSDGIPGYSGGTTLSIFNFYDTLFNKIRWLFRKTKWSIWFNNVLFLLPFLVSWIIFLIAFSFFTSFVSDQGKNYQIVLFFLFFSFSVFCIPIFILKNFFNNWHKIKNDSKKNKTIYIFLTIFFFIVIVSIGIGLYYSGGIILEKDNTSKYVDFNPYTIFILFTCFLSGFCMLIPGISGSLVLFLSQTYDEVYWVVLQNPIENIGLLILIGIFIAIGVITSIFLINFLIKKFYYFFKFISLGLVIGAPIAMLLSFFGNNTYVEQINQMFSQQDNSIIFLFLVIVISLLVNIGLTCYFVFKNKYTIKKYSYFNINKNSALIVVDMQNDFYIKGNLEVKNSDKIANFITNSINYFKLNNLKVIYSQDFHPIDHCSFKEWPIHCVQKQYGSEFVDFINKENADLIVQKGTSKEIDNYSAFYNGNKQSCLEHYLKNNNIKNLYILGLAGDFCVKQTALDAIKFGFNVILLHDGIKSVDQNYDLSTIDTRIKII